MPSPSRTTSRRSLLRSAILAAAATPLVAIGRAWGSGAPSPRTVVDAYFRAARRRDTPAILALFAPDAVYEDVTFDFRIVGHEPLRRMFDGAFAAMESAERRMRRTVAEGPHVVVEWVATGRHTGTMLGVGATGRPITIRAVSIIEVADERIVRVTDYTDRAGLEAQLRAGRG